MFHLCQIEPKFLKKRNAYYWDNERKPRIQSVFQPIKSGCYIVTFKRKIISYIEIFALNPSTEMNMIKENDDHLLIASAFSVRLYFFLLDCIHDVTLGIACFHAALRIFIVRQPKQRINHIFFPVVDAKCVVCFFSRSHHFRCPCSITLLR